MTAPHLQVIRGDASPEDIATLLTVFAALQGGAQTQESLGVNAWSDRAAMMRGFPAPGPGAWRASGLVQ